MKPNTLRRMLAGMLLFVLALPGRAQNQSAPSSSNGSTGWSASWNDDRSFIENKGQFYVRKSFGGDTRVLYGYDASFSRVFFKKQGVTFSFTQKSKPLKKEEHEEHPRNEREFLKEEREEKAAVLKTDEISYYWEGASENVEIIPEGQLSNYYSYSFTSGGAERNVNMIPGYTKLLYKNLYPNIDVEYTLHPENGIKYALIVHPGADLSKVKMVYSDRTALGADGGISIDTKFGPITDHAPVTFYENAPQRTIGSHFIRNGKTISFAVDQYDARETIVIDPWTQTPTLTNSNKVWETETSSAGDVYIYGGDSFIKLLKYNSTGTLQWTYTSPWDSANYWIGGFITHPNGDSYMTSGSNGEIRKISNAGAVVWSNNPNSLTSYEYWSLAFNCDLTKLVVGGSRLQFGFPTPTIRGTIMNINLASGAILSTTVVGFGSTTAIPPNVQEVSSICYAPNGNFYFLTLDTLGSINNALSTINFKIPTSYAFDYYIPGYGFGTKQPISAIRANATAVYTLNGATVEKRSLANGSVMATAAIPSGSYTNTFFGRKVNGNGGIDIDNCGNVYVGTVNGVIKYDGNLNLLTNTPTTFAVYDVDVNANGEVAACGWSGGTGKVQTINFSACAQITYVCSSVAPLSVTSVQTNPQCFGACTGTATVTASGGTAPYTYAWTPTGGNAATASSLCANSYTCTITDATSATTTILVTITQPPVISTSISPTNATCGNNNGSASVTASGGTGTLTYAWTPSGGNAATASNLGPGTYTCTITDANNCTTTISTTITNTPAPTVSLQSSSNVTCNAGTNGSATVNASGTGPFTYSWAPSGGNAATASNLAAGSYTCTVTGAGGCTATQIVNITEPGAISASATSTPATCGNNNGSATVTASGGTGTLTYSWAPSGGNAATANNLAAGNYTCTITDANGCTTTANASIANTSGPTVTVQSTADVTCFGAGNGTATVNATGNSPFTYSWSPSGGNAATATNLGPGSYTVTVTDAGNCASTQIITITEPTALSGSATSTPATCGNADGSATASVSGGTGSYTYAWAPSGGTGATENNIAAGSYSCMVTDANGCTTTVNVTVSNTGGPTVTLQSSGNVSCFGLSDGTATVNATGNSPFTYTWSPSGGNAATASNLAAGTYTVVVADAGNCTTSQVVTITQPTAISASATTTPATCGNNNGTATASVSGGTGSYTYSWAPSGGSNASANNLAGGSYTVTITDANGCTTTANATVANSGAPVVTLQGWTDVTCFGGANGSASVTVTGGSSPYTYAWSPSGGNAASASGLGAGTYTITVTGSDGCAQTQIAVIIQPTAIAPTATSTPELCGNSDGTAAVSVTGGTPGYTYSWSPGGATTASITALSSGAYTCTITDANGCTQTATVAVGAQGTALADAGTSVLITQGQSTTLNGTGGGTYAWSPPGSLSCSNCQNPVATPTTTTTYTLVVTDSLGCTATDTVTIFVDILCGELYLPNAFSPNDDHENDVLYVRGNCIKFLDFEVFNRWGEKVFMTTDPSFGWDGTWRGKKCEAAVFTYFLRATLQDGTEIEKQGNISLVK